MEREKEEEMPVDVRSGSIADLFDRRNDCRSAAEVNNVAMNRSRNRFVNQKSGSGESFTGFHSFGTAFPSRGVRL